MKKFDMKRLEKEANRDLAEGNVDGNVFKPTTTDQLLTKEKLKRMVPRGVNVEITDEVFDKIVNMQKQIPELDQGLFEEQLVTYSSLLGPGIGYEKLANAIKYVTLLFMPKMTASKAYEIVFPEKTKEVMDRGGDISSFATQYGKTKVVKEILKTVVIPPSIQYAPSSNLLFSRLMNLSAGVGAKPDDYVSPTVQLNATVAALDYIKPAEDTQINVSINGGEQEKSFQNKMLESLDSIVKSQREALKRGVDLKDAQKVGVLTDGSLKVNEEIIDV